MYKHYAIAIDGPSGAGKSSLARRMAKELGFIYVDTGAIYRCVGLAAYRAQADSKNEEAVAVLLPQLNIEMRYNEAGEQCMILNGEDVSGEIRSPEISLYASNVSAHKKVRAYLLDMQRRLARENSVIMDGRDIGTVVLPNAELKIYLTASAEARAQRRLLEHEAKGLDISFRQVLEDICRRDEQDMNRETAPLRQAEDAVLVDSSDIDFEETFEKLMSVVEENLGLKGKNRA